MEKTEINVISRFKVLIESYLDLLSVQANKTISKQQRDIQKRKILEYSYGLKSKLYSRVGISYLLVITVERVRQITNAVIGEIRAIINEKNSDIFTSYYIADINEIDLYFKKERVLSKNKFNECLRQKFQINTEQDKAYINLLIDVLGYKVSKIHLHLLKDNDLIFFDNSLDSILFIKICYATYISIEKNTIPTELNDIIINVKRNLNQITIDNSLIDKALTVIDDCELINKNNIKLYQVAFYRLSSASDMAYRILFETGQRMMSSEIHREINHRLNQKIKKKIEKVSLNTQMCMDKRFLPLGKTGVWTLAEWGEDNLSMYELVTNTLLHFNSPLTKKDIISHIHKSRSFIPVRSLQTIICDSRYIQLKDKKFILKEWKDSYKDRIASVQKRHVITKENKIRDQIKEQILDLFATNDTDKLLMTSITNTLNKKFKFHKASIYRIISEDDEFESVNIDSYRKQVILKSLKKMDKAQRKSTSVFVSYCWESATYKEKVISFVNFLRQNGFVADMDIKFIQEETAVDFNLLMHKGILNYDKIIILLSENYKKKAESFDGGVGKEYKFILSDIPKNPNKYIFASFESITMESIDRITPVEFKGREIVDLVNDENKKFEKLFSKLTDFEKYIFSDVASETPILEKKKIEAFTLK
jgi:SEFIR domain